VLIIVFFIFEKRFRMAISRRDQKSVRRKVRIIKSVVLVFLIMILLVGGYAAYVFVNE
jgi:hypothetical protein